MVFVFRTARVPRAHERAGTRAVRKNMTRSSYSTVTLLARLRGWSTSVPLATAV